MMRNNTPIQASQAPVALNDASYDEAFARAFDAAQEEIFSQENASSTDHLQEGMQDTLGRDLSSTMEQEIEQTFDLNDADLLRTRPLESATIEQHDDIKQQDDNDDLARTASELLDKVRHDQSEKFQNSAFLGLMRRLRDREVKVDGDKMVETGSVSATAQPAQAGLQSHMVPPATTQMPIQPSNLTGQAEAALSNDVVGQASRDGEDVVRLLDEPSTLDQDPEYTMISPFYDNQHAELGRQGLWQDYDHDE